MCFVCINLKYYLKYKSLNLYSSTFLEIMYPVIFHHCKILYQSWASFRDIRNAKSILTIQNVNSRYFDFVLAIKQIWYAHQFFWSAWYIVRSEVCSRHVDFPVYKHISQLVALATVYIMFD